MAVAVVSAQSPNRPCIPRSGSPERIVRDAAANPAVYRSLYRYTASLCKDSHFAEDLVQDVIVRAIERASAFRGEGSVEGWLKAIARTTFLMAVRAKRETPGEVVDSQAPSAEDEAIDELARQEAKRIFSGTLPDKDAQLVDLYYGRELSTEAIAKLIDTTECAVKCRLYRLRRRAALTIEALGVAGAR
jgi:RNA polymerase sigma-70 factor, ECF subfamily